MDDGAARVVWRAQLVEAGDEIRGRRPTIIVAFLLVVVNLGFAGPVAVVVRRWREARQEAATPLDPEGTVSVRLRRRPWDDDEVERCVHRALGSSAFVPTGGGSWGDRRGAAARVTPPVVGDRATLVEVSAREADGVVSGLVRALIDEGYELSRRKGRKVSLRRGPDRVDLQVDPV